MKISILTSNIFDGLVVSQRLMDSGKDIVSIIYEKKLLSYKAVLKRVLYRIKGVLKGISYETIAKRNGKLFVAGVENIVCDRTREIINNSSPDLIVVVGTRKLPPDIFDKARLGAINMHSGILPYYRGADSEFWALHNGEKDKIGVTIHFVDEKLDTGDIVLQARQKVTDADDHKSLRMKNIFLGADKIVEAITLIEKGSYSRLKQDENFAKSYKSATREDIRKYRG